MFLKNPDGVFDLAKDQRVHRAIQLLSVGAYYVAREELLHAYADACLFGTYRTRQRLLTAIEWLTWQVPLNAEPDRVHRRILQILFSDDAEEY